MCELYKSCGTLAAADKVAGCAYESCFDGYGLATYLREPSKLEIVDKWPVAGGEAGVPIYVQTENVPEGTAVYCAVRQKGESLPSTLSSLKTIDAKYRYTGKVADGVAYMLAMYETTGTHLYDYREYTIKCFDGQREVSSDILTNFPDGYEIVLDREGDSGYCRGANNCIYGYVPDVSLKPYLLSQCRAICEGDSRCLAFQWRISDGHCGIAIPRTGCESITTVKADPLVQCWRKSTQISVHNIGSAICSKSCTGTCAWQRQLGDYTRNYFALPPSCSEISYTLRIRLSTSTTTGADSPDKFAMYLAGTDGSAWTAPVVCCFKQGTSRVLELNSPITYSTLANIKLRAYTASTDAWIIAAVEVEDTDHTFETWYIPALGVIGEVPIRYDASHPEQREYIFTRIITPVPNTPAPVTTLRLRVTTMTTEFAASESSFALFIQRTDGTTWQAPDICCFVKGAVDIINLASPILPGDVQAVTVEAYAVSTDGWDIGSVEVQQADGSYELYYIKDYDKVGGVTLKYENGKKKYRFVPLRTEAPSTAVPTPAPLTPAPPTPSPTGTVTLWLRITTGNGEFSGSSSTFGFIVYSYDAWTSWQSPDGIVGSSAGAVAVVGFDSPILPQDVSGVTIRAWSTSTDGWEIVSVEMLLDGSWQVLWISELRASGPVQVKFAVGLYEYLWEPISSAAQPPAVVPTLRLRVTTATDQYAGSNSNFGVFFFNADGGSWKAPAVCCFSNGDVNVFELASTIMPSDVAKIRFLAGPDASDGWTIASVEMQIEDGTYVLCDIPALGVTGNVILKYGGLTKLYDFVPMRGPTPMPTLAPPAITLRLRVTTGTGQYDDSTSAFGLVISSSATSWQAPDISNFEKGDVDIFELASPILPADVTSVTFEALTTSSDGWTIASVELQDDDGSYEVMWIPALGVSGNVMVKFQAGQKAYVFEPVKTPVPSTPIPPTPVPTTSAPPVITVRLRVTTGSDEFANSSSAFALYIFKSNAYWQAPSISNFATGSVTIIELASPIPLSDVTSVKFKAWSSSLDGWTIASVELQDDDGSYEVMWIPALGVAGNVMVKYQAGNAEYVFEPVRTPVPPTPIPPTPAPPVICEDTCTAYTHSPHPHTSYSSTTGNNTEAAGYHRQWSV
eukprot:TRINITY_DN343_c0_g1_i5.p1 TRINITY_DN343_c0_g1~~TRINITY_DN343_c0_g1_i5.p1  ORF type:complete len:1154 (+),score=270.45 TRINITY_DN343_c0_g1_i5:60-3464(+)